MGVIYDFGGGKFPSARSRAAGRMTSSGPRNRLSSLGIFYTVTTAGWLIICVHMTIRIAEGDEGPNGGNWFQLILAAVLTPLFAGMAVHQYRLSKKKPEDADGSSSNDSDLNLT